MAINKARKDLNHAIDRLLNERRPDRYLVSETIRKVRDADEEDEGFPQDDEGPEVENADWLNAVADEVAYMVSPEKAREEYVRTVVGLRERQATRNANKLLRDFYRTGQHEMGWLEMVRDPLAIKSREVLWGGQIRTRDERVALGKCTVPDLRRFATEERRRSAKDFVARETLAAGAEQLADRVEGRGMEYVDEYFEFICKEPGSGTDN